MTLKENAWVVRAGEGGYLFDEFKKNGIVAIGWNEIGNLTNVTDPNKIKEMVKDKYPNYSAGKLAMTAAQIKHFRFDIKNDDSVVTYDPQNRIYLVGKVQGEYKFLDIIQNYGHAHKVKWLGTVERDKLSTTTKNTLGAISTLFELPEDVRNEIFGVLEGKKPETGDDIEKSEEDLESLKEDMENKAREFIKDRLTRLDWEDMQELVAGVLRAMGYKTTISPKGADGGRDIFASPDGLGLEEPRIVVEVKHRQGPMGRREVASFIGGMRKGHKGLYVSTGGFSKDAKTEADRSEIPLTLVDMERLTDLVVENYDKFDTEARELIPMARIYWPE